MWYRLSTKKTWPQTLVGVLFGLILATGLLVYLAVNTAAVTGQAHTIGFQGRLLTKTGAPVKDGHYNMQFRIYQGGPGQKVKNPGGKLVWDESYLNSGKQKGIQVKNGRFSIQLGSSKPFGNQVDWSQAKLWLSMNVAGSSNCSVFGGGSCSADGELLPMKHISASPYAMSAGKLGNKTADDFLQLGQGKQTDTSDDSSIFVNKTGKGDLIRLQNNGDDTFTVANSGDITLSGHSDRSISLSKNKGSGGGSDLTIAAGASGDKSSKDGGDLILRGGDGGKDSSSGGNIVLRGGSGNNNDSEGLVIIGTPTFATTTNDASCYPDGKLAAADCTVTETSLNTTAAIIVGFRDKDRTATLPSPKIKTAGRIIYIIGASQTEDFSLKLGDTENTITVQRDTAASLLWNGEAWIPIGMREPTPATPPADNDDQASQDEPTQPTDDEPADVGSIEATDDDSDADEDTAVDEAAVVGSMFYDDELGKIQCYQIEGWGDCLEAPDVFITISPEYAGAVMNGNDIGTITSDLCSGTLKINDGSDDQPEICNSDETHNFYSWNSDEIKSQTRSIYLTYKLPANFKKFIDKSASLTARTDSDNAGVSYHIYRDHKKEGLSACGDATKLEGQPDVWRNLKAINQADPAKCDFSAGDSLLLRIDMTARDGASAYVSDIDFIYSSY